MTLMNLNEKKFFFSLCTLFSPSVIISCFPGQNFSDDFVAGVCEDGEFNNVFVIWKQSENKAIKPQCDKYDKSITIRLDKQEEYMASVQAGKEAFL